MENIKDEKFRIPADIDDSYENYCNEIISFINLSSKNIAHIINVVNMIKHQTYDDVKYSEIIRVSTQMMNDEIKKFNKNMKKISIKIPNEYINNI